MNLRQLAASAPCHLRPARRGYLDGYRPQAKTRDLLDSARAVLNEYRDHWPLTCRQIFYRLIGAHGFEKSEGFYSKLCHHLANARRARVIPFKAIRDDGVSTVTLDHFDDADHFRARVRRQAETYRRNVMADQRLHVEVWCEAAGMILQLADVAHRYSVPVYSSSGFDSLTAKKALADRICSIGKPAVIIHLGDYDPSGAAMFSVIAEDVGAFVAADRPWGGVDVRFERVALNAEQVAAYGLATAPAKASDSRSARWEGGTCQLEALAPDQIAELLDNAIMRLIDAEAMGVALNAEADERRALTRFLTGPSENQASPKTGDAG